MGIFAAKMGRIQSLSSFPDALISVAPSGNVNLNLNLEWQGCHKTWAVSLPARPHLHQMCR